MPDLNSVPPSPRVLAAARHQSGGAAGGNPAAPTPTSPPPVSPAPSSIHVFPSNQSAVAQVGTQPPSSLPSPYFPPLAISGGPPASQSMDGPGVGPGPGPLRHPRPLTAAELHMQLEKEQEAVVNRLTRELTLLRAQNASVVSNASSTSAGAGSDAAASAAGPPEVHSLLSGTTGFSIPSSAGRHNRTYSNTSTRSQTASAGATPSVVAITSPAPIRPSAPMPIRPSAAAPGLSRQNSTASRRSRANSPGPGPSPYSSSYLNDGSYFQSAQYTQHPHPHAHAHAHHAHHQHQHQHSMHSTRGATPSVDLSPAILPGTARYDDISFFRAELESVKRENDALKRRIRELERAAAGAASTSPPSASAAGTPSSLQAQPSQTPPMPPTPQPQPPQPPVDSQAGQAGQSRHGRSESASTTDSVRGLALLSTTPSSAVSVAGSTLPSVSGGASGTATAATAASAAMAASSYGGMSITGPRDRVMSMLSTTGSAAGSIGIGVPEDEVRVGESAASAGLPGQEGSAPASTA